MNHFVQGVLTVDDEAYILDPDIRLANGEKIHILYYDIRPDVERAKEEEDPLSLLLEVDQWYELLLVAQIGLGRARRVTYMSETSPGIGLDLKATETLDPPETRRIKQVVQGVILDLDWDAASQQYLAVAGPVVYTRRFILVETAIGKLVLNYQDVQDQLGEQAAQLAPGGYLTWKPARLDLLAILAKRDPQPGE